MCGISGGISFNGVFFPEVEKNEAIVGILKYRGPDDNGVVQLQTQKAKVNFIHTRLSIIDLGSTGRQPMSSGSGNSCIVFNGEIYNYKAIRQILENKGFRFLTNSDTEVILNAYECWGIDEAVQKLDGMFALALFDKLTETLYLVRDRFGKKPLYYYAQGKKLMFSSDIRSFKHIKDIDLTIDLHALGYFFSELATPHESTIWKQIKKLKPGTYLKFNEDANVNHQFWTLPYTEDCKLNRSEIVERTDYLLSEAVKKRLVSDVNVGALLSGGIDSSLIVAKMAENRSERIKTYSVGFTEEQFTELPYARQVADRFNTDHTEFIVDARSFSGIDKLILEFGEPFADASMIPMYLISREITKSEKVVLGGDGGDELFGGYSSYHFAHKYDSVKKFRGLYPLAYLMNMIWPSYRTDLLKRLLRQTYQPDFVLLHRNFGFDSRDLKSLKNEEEFFNANDNEHEKIWLQNTTHSKNALINVLSASLKTRLLNNYLVKIDRASMYASLEMRSPFLDKDLAAFASTFTPQQLFYQTGTKSILKEVAEKYFTQEFVNRKKMGFGVPVSKWFQHELANYLLELIVGGKQDIITLDYTYIERIIKEHINGVSDHSNQIWCLYVFHVWAHGNK